MAHTNVKLPRGGYGLHKSVQFDPELKGEHHELLLASSPAMFERNMVAVVDSLLDGAKAHQLGLPDALYLFFIARTNTLGPEFKGKYKCDHKPGNGTTCGEENVAVFDLSKVDIKFADPNAKVEKFPFVAKLADGSELPTTIHVSAPTVGTDLELLDDFQDRGHTREDIMADNTLAYEFAKLRLHRAVRFGEDTLNELTYEDKEALLKRSINFTLTNTLLKTLAMYDKFGLDLSPKEFKCKKCGGVTRLRMPMSGSFLLSDF